MTPPTSSTNSNIAFQSVSHADTNTDTESLEEDKKLMPPPLPIPAATRSSLEAATSSLNLKGVAVGEQEASLGVKFQPNLRHKRESNSDSGSIRPEKRVKPAEVEDAKSDSVVGKHAPSITIQQNIEISFDSELDEMAFKGVCHIGYIPKEERTDCSELSVIVNDCTKRVRTVSVLVKDISIAIQNALGLEDVAVLIEGKGVKLSQGGQEQEFKNSDHYPVSSKTLSGQFENDETKEDFYLLLGRQFS